VVPEQGESLEAPLLFLDVEPWPHQREMLEKLAVERERHHRFKNLVVAATGTGKTISRTRNGTESWTPDSGASWTIAERARPRRPR
jgi:hypothetical protein